MTSRSTPHASRWGIFTTCALLATWGIIFVSGAMSPAEGARHIASKLRRPPASARPLNTGESVSPDALRQLRDSLGDFKALLFVRAQASPRMASVQSYVALLEERYRASGLAVAMITSDTARFAASDLVARATGMTTGSRGTLLLDARGVVVYGSMRTADQDLLRQIVERQIVGQAAVDFADSAYTGVDWPGRLRGLRLTALDSVATVRDPLDYSIVAIFDSHCGECTAARHLGYLRREMRLVERSETYRGTLGIFPSHYRPVVERLADSLPGLTIAFSATHPLPNLAYVSRDVPAARPILLHVRKGHVDRVARLGGAR